MKFRCLSLTLVFVASTINGGGGSLGLEVLYGGSGIQKVSYNGLVLEDLSVAASDAFHIGHMQVTDLSGNILGKGQSNWGETNNGKAWSRANNTWTYKFAWGSITLQFAQAGDTLSMKVVTTNLAGSGIIFDGAAIYPLVLHFPNLPSGFKDPTYEQLSFGTTGPSVLLADYGKGEVAMFSSATSRPLYSGFLPASPTNAYTPIISDTALDGMASFVPRASRPLMPGQTDSYTVSLKFAPSGTPASALGTDAYKSWAQTWPPVLKWNDRRIIGTVYLASSPSGKPRDPGGYPNNPRRYFNDSNAHDFDVRVPSGLANFQHKILEQAANNVLNLKRLKAQGAITWDIEGEQYPQSTSYVCAPDEVAHASPEMETVVGDPASPYHGMKLDDAYFKTMRDAALRVGVCVRPQHFQMNADGTAGQISLPDAQVSMELIRKMGYAHKRWGVTLFYLDSTVDANGAPLNASILRQAAEAFPDSLIIPEESTPRHYAYTAPFLSFLFHRDLGTNADIYNYYPNAFSANLINDVDASTLAKYRGQLTTSVRRGDILMVHADYWQANNPTAVGIYEDAGRSSVR